MTKQQAKTVAKAEKKADAPVTTQASVATNQATSVAQSDKPENTETVQTGAQTDDAANQNAANVSGDEGANAGSVIDSGAITGDEKDDVDQSAADAVVVIGRDPQSNAQALEALLTGHHELPLVLRAENKMPRDVCFPQIVGLSMGNCAASEQERCATVTLRSFDDLHRVVLDIQAVCDLNGFAEGVALQVITEAD